MPGRVVGFELVCGELPRKVSELPLLEALRVLREDRAPSLESVDRRFRGDLSLIFAKALEPDPDQRYASAEALAEDIRRYLANETILARSLTVTYQLRRFVRRNRKLVAAASVAVISLVGGLILALVARAEESRQRGVAQEQTRRAERETARALEQEERSKRAAYAAQIQTAALALRTHDAPRAQAAARPRRRRGSASPPLTVSPCARPRNSKR